MTAYDRAAVGRPAMVGRGNELSTLREALDGAIAGTAHAVVVAGEAGIGKSRLLAEFRLEASERARILFGQCVDWGAGGAPYAAIVGMLRSLVEQIGAETVLESAGPGREALTVLLPELAEHSVNADNAGAERLHEVVAVLLESSARDQPTVVILEDLHWADDATLIVLRFLLGALTEGRILLVLSYRSDDVRRAHPLRAFLAETRRGHLAQHIELEGLTRDEVRKQIVGLTGHAPRADLLESVVERSDGVPFFVEELLALDATGDRLPETLRDLLLTRYDQLEDPAQQLLRLLSAGGMTVVHHLLEAVYDREDAELDAAAREAVLANILIAGESAYSFRHALVREAIHAELLPGERHRFHTRYAEVLQNRPELAGSSGPAAAAIAEHWFAANNQEQALKSAVAAMVQARSSYAYGTAARLGERALSLWDVVPGPGPLAGMTHVDLLAETASVLRNASDGERSLALINQAIEECVDRDGLRFARLLRDKAYYLANRGLPGSVPLLEQGLALVPRGADDLLRTALLNTLAARLMHLGELDRAIDVADEALTLAMSVDAPGRASVAANLAGLCRVQRGEVDAGSEQLERARELASGDPSALLRYLLNASDLQYRLGRFAVALRLAEEGLVCARELGVERRSGVLLASNAIDPLLALGRWDEAGVLTDRSLALVSPAGSRVSVQRAKLWQLLWRGDPDAAAVQYRAWRAAMTPPQRISAHMLLAVNRVLAEIDLAQGDLSSAWTHVCALFSGKHGSVPGYDLPLLVAAARALALQKASGAVAPTSSTRAEAVTEHPMLTALPTTILAYEQAVSALRALLDAEAFWPTWGVWAPLFEAELGGDGTGNGVETWRRALVAAESGPAHLRPYAMYRLGKALFANGGRAEARQVLRAASQAAATLGAGLVGKWVDEFAGRAGLSLSAEMLERQAASEELTAREQQVLDLVAQGMTNRQIGNALFISAKTASVHVSAILRKLGATSRTEAASVASFRATESRRDHRSDDE